MPGKNKTPLVGWHPAADLSAWLEAEVERRGGGKGVRSAILNEALSEYRNVIACRVCNDTGTVQSPEPDGGGVYDSACPEPIHDEES